MSVGFNQPQEPRHRGKLLQMPRSFIAVGAHELQHALEVAQAPEVRDAEGVQKLFKQIGSCVSCALPVYETFEAIAVQDVVTKELKARRADGVDELRDNRPALVRVRSNSPAIAELIRQASERSATFKGLVATIDHTDGIVYVVEGTCGHGVRACLLLSVTRAGQYRILHIKVDRRKEGNELMTTIGHELQHAIEVLSDVSLTNWRAIYNFYDRLAPTDQGRFETDAAIQAGLDVRAEVDASARSR